MKAIINARIYDYENYIENGFVIFNNTIVNVGPMYEFSGHFETIDAKGMLLIPGLVNGHTHIYSALFRGSPLKASPNNFNEILDQIWWHFDKQLDLESIEESANAYARDSLFSGVTSLIDHHASGVISGSLGVIHKVLEKYSIKHLLCFESSDRFEIQTCIDENTTSYSDYFGLHASLSLSDQSLNMIKDKCVKPIHVHVAEARVDEDLCLINHGKRVVKRLHDFALLKKDSILAHCIHIDQEEVDLINYHKSVVAINPTSNLNNAVGMYQQELLAKNKIDILVGSDGLGANIAKEYQHLYYVGNQSNQHPSKISLDWIKDQMKFSYEYFNRMKSCRIGRIQTNYDADFILIDYKSNTPIDETNIFAHILFGAFEALRPKDVFVGGIKVIDQYQLIVGRPTNQQVVEELWRRL